MDKRPTYDPIQGANVTPSTFYNIGNLEIQENLARIWYEGRPKISCFGKKKLSLPLIMVLTHASNRNFLNRVDIGTSEPLLLDVLINALTQISSE